MRKHPVRPVCVALAAIFLGAAPAAFSEMYRWVDDQGAVKYSNQRPPDAPGMRNVTVIDDTPGTMTPAEQRTLEILNAHREIEATPAATGGMRGAPGPLGTAGEELPMAPRASVAPNMPEAVRDPCLTSADPRCPEKNRAYYVPGRGYAPSAVRLAREAETSPGAGATTGAAGNGALTGGAIIPPPRVAPPSSSYALPGGSFEAVDLRRP